MVITRGEMDAHLYRLKVKSNKESVNALKGKSAWEDREDNLCEAQGLEGRT